jgi:hypothetical protein
MPHLLTLWNPACATDALEAHLALLLDWDARATAGTAGSDDVHVWLGKVRSAHRLQPMPHPADILALGDALADAQLWARFDAEQGGVGALEATLRDDHLGERAWLGLDAAARRFLATAERTLRDHRADPAADLAPVVIGYAKAIEVQVNRLLAGAVGGERVSRTDAVHWRNRLLGVGFESAVGRLGVAGRHGAPLG